MPWHPPPRPRWVERLNQHAAYAGGADLLVSLDPDEMMATAAEQAGLDDFGDDLDGARWRTSYDILTESLAKESPLHLVGRTMSRADILRALRNRLELVALWRREPQILTRPVREPLFVVGAARSGTSILHELLALDPGHAAPTTWKVHHPVTAAGDDADAKAAARRSTDAVVSFWHDVQPEYEAMHHNGGELPTECIFITLPTFLSDNWGGSHVAPSYDIHNATADHTHAYEWHRRTLQTLQGEGATTRWVLKAPSHLPTLRQLFAVYPDARVIHIHRDPARTLPSMLDLMGTLKSMRNDDVDLDALVEPITRGMAHLQARTIADRRRGTIPDERFHDLHYAQLLADPAAAVTGAYQHFGWPVPEGFAPAIDAYISAKPKGSKGHHDYSLATFGLTAASVREQFRDYLDHFAIEQED